MRRRKPQDSDPIVKCDYAPHFIGAASVQTFCPNSKCEVRMATMVEIVESVNLEPNIQDGTTVADDSATESQLNKQITTLWSDHVRLSSDRKTTVKQLRQIRANLAECLHEMKSILSRPGRLGQWRGWLKQQQRIPRSTADRLVARHAETIGIENGNVLSETSSEPAEQTAERLARGVWLRLRKVLTADESIVGFIGCIAELSGIRHEWRQEGLVIFKPGSKAEEELPGSTSATGTVQSPDEVPAITDQPGEESATVLPMIEQAAAGADAGVGAGA